MKGKLKMIKIAVIDSGIDLNNRELMKHCIIDRSLQIDNLYDVNDYNGHGSFCTKTILDINKEVEIYPIKIFKRRKCNSTKLIMALKKILNSKIDIVSISSSTLEDRNKIDLNDICRRLKKQGKIIISSCHNDANGNFSYPASLDSVIGVKGCEEIYNDNDYLYKKENDIQMSVNFYGKIYNFNEKEYYFARSSRATAVATGIISKKFKQKNKCNFEKFEKILSNDSRIEKSFTQYNLECKEKYYKDKNRIDISKRILSIINEYFSEKKILLEDLILSPLINKRTGVYKNNIGLFIGLINKEFKINIDYNNIYLYEIINIYILIDCIYGNLNIAKSNEF